MGTIPDSVVGASIPKPGAKFKALFSWRGAICESDLPAHPRYLALVLSLHMNELGGSCFPSLETLSSQMACSRSSVLKSLTALTESGWLTVKRGGGRGVPNSYTATVPDGNRTVVVPFPKPETAPETVPEPSINSTAAVLEDVNPLGRKDSSLEAKASKARTRQKKLKRNWVKLWLDSGGAPSRSGHVGRVCGKAQESYPLDAIDLAVKRVAEENRSPDAIDLIAHELTGDKNGHRSAFERTWAQICELAAAGRGRQSLDPRAQRAWVACWGEVDGRYVDLDKGGFLKAWRET